MNEVVENSNILNGFGTKNNKLKLDGELRVYCL